MTPAGRHRRIAAAFTERVDRVRPSGWGRPSPVPEWTARDVVGHLVDWSRGLLASGVGSALPGLPPIDADPAATWRAHAAWIQEVVDDPGERRLANPHLGELPLAEAIDRFSTSDVLMHTWDLARATGQDDRLDPDECAALLAGMEPMEDLLRDSGQYGARVPVEADADAQDRLLGFIGRDPHWR